MSSALLATSCGSKTDDPQGPAQVQKAQLSGRATAGAVTQVTATDAANKAVTATPTATGDFTFASLPVGTYTLTFTVADEYLVPTPQTVQLPAAGLVLPLLTVALPAPVVTYVLDGKLMTITPGSGYVTNSSPYAVLTFVTSANEWVYIFAKYPLTLGQHDLKTYTEFAEYNAPTGVRYVTDPVRTTFTTSGVLDITKLNPNTHRASGSFSFVAGRSSVSGTSADPNTHAVINGTFTGLPYNP